MHDRNGGLPAIRRRLARSQARAIVVNGIKQKRKSFQAATARLVLMGASPLNVAIGPRDSGRVTARVRRVRSREKLGHTLWQESNLGRSHSGSLIRPNRTRSRPQFAISGTVAKPAQDGIFGLSIGSASSPCSPRSSALSGVTLSLGSSRRSLRGEKKNAFARLNPLQISRVAGLAGMPLQ